MSETTEVRATLNEKDAELIAQAMTQALESSGMGTFGQSRAAARAIGNVQNTTEHYGLPLPAGNEQMAYQDFINTPNKILDETIYQISQDVSSMTATVNQISNNVGSLDTKVDSLQQNVADYDIPALKTEVESIDSRLSTVEEDTMSFIAPTYQIATRGGYVIDGVMRSGGLLIAISQPVNMEATSSGYINTPSEQLQYGNFVFDNFSDLRGFEFMTISGNILNLPTMNSHYKVYKYPCMMSYTMTVQSGQPQLLRYPITAIYNGVNTVFYVWSPVPNTNQHFYSNMLIIPLGVY